MSGCVCMCMDVHGYVWVIMYVRDFMSTVAAHAHSLHANRETLPVSCTGIMRLNHAAILQSWCVHDVYLVVRVCVLDFRFSFSLSVCVCVSMSLASSFSHVCCLARFCTAGKAWLLQQLHIPSCHPRQSQLPSLLVGKELVTHISLCTPATPSQLANFFDWR